MKILGFEAMEGGIVLHCPSGKRKVCPLSDDQDAVASALGGLVLEVLMDRSEQDADKKPALRAGVVEEIEEDDEEDDEYEDEPPPRRRGKKKRRKRSASAAMGGVNFRPRKGEDADGYVDRVGKEAGFNLLRGAWRGLQRMSGTEVDD